MTEEGIEMIPDQILVGLHDGGKIIGLIWRIKVILNN